jgi:hypothetical protein
MTKVLYFVIVAVLLVSAVRGDAELFNASFELMRDPCDGESFHRPLYWDSENFAAIDSNFTPVPEHGQTPFWYFEDETIIPFDGNNCLILSTDDIDIDGGERHASAIQDYNFVESLTIEFYYFFGTFDYMPYGDYATVNLVNSRPKEIFRVAVDDVGNYKSTDGWIRAEKYLDPCEINVNYDDFWAIEFKVEDATDAIYKTYFAVDAVRIGYKPEEGDYNDDWLVNFEDFAVFARDWQMADASIVDPNVDIDDNNYVDVNDMMIFCDHWLDGAENQEY